MVVPRHDGQGGVSHPAHELERGDAQISTAGSESVAESVELGHAPTRLGVRDDGAEIRALELAVGC